MATKFHALAVDWLELATEKLRNEFRPERMIVENDLENAIFLVSSPQLPTDLRDMTILEANLVFKSFLSA